MSPHVETDAVERQLPREHWIKRIDQAQAVLTLSVQALLSEGSPYNADIACALDLANDELQRLRDEIDASQVIGRTS